MKKEHNYFQSISTSVYSILSIIYNKLGVKIYKKYIKCTSLWELEISKYELIVLRDYSDKLKS